MYKSLLAILFLTSASDARRSQLQTDLERSDAVGELATFLFASLPFVPVSSLGPARSSVLQANGGQEEVRNRIDSTKKAAKITKTMKLVAAARARKAALAAQESKPFVEELRRTANKLSDRLVLEDTSDIPLFEMRPAKKVALLVITGDRGLCGAYNTKILKKTEQRIAELKDLGIGTEIFSIGSKGNKYFARRDYELTEYDCGNAPTSEQSQAIIKEVIGRFLEGEVDRVELIYTSFTSMVDSTASIRTIIPFTVSKDGIEMDDDEIKFTSKDGKLAVESSPLGGEQGSFSAEMVLEQSPEDLTNAIMPMYLNGGLLSAWQNAIAAELGSRYTAMQAATDNAEALKDDLEKQLNRMRQAGITQEISEIVAGATAV